MGWRSYIALSLIALLAAPVYALDISHAPPDSKRLLINETSQRHIQYSLNANTALAPYVSLEHNERPDQWDDYWRDHSYESSNRPKRGNAWAGVKVKLTKMLRLDVDTDTRHVRSSVNLSPKTKMKFRVKPKAVRVDFVYRY